MLVSSLARPRPNQHTSPSFSGSSCAFLLRRRPCFVTSNTPQPYQRLSPLLSFTLSFISATIAALITTTIEVATAFMVGTLALSRRLEQF